MVSGSRAKVVGSGEGARVLASGSVRIGYRYKVIGLCRARLLCAGIRFRMGFHFPARVRVVIEDGAVVDERGFEVHAGIGCVRSGRLAKSHSELQDENNSCAICSGGERRDQRFRV